MLKQFVVLGVVGLGYFNIDYIRPIVMSLL